MQVYTINGLPGAGKDLFVNYVTEIMDETWCHNISMVDFVKYIAQQCGWDNTKTPKNRAFLANLKELLEQWDDVPMKQVLYKIHLIESEYAMWDLDEYPSVCFVHCRSDYDIKTLKEKKNAKSILVVRDSVDTSTISNTADAIDLNPDHYDIIVNNNGTKVDLIQEAIKFLKNENLCDNLDKIRINEHGCIERIG